MTELSRAFDLSAASYERGRPGYPADAIAHLGPTIGVVPGARVLDLAAGTGKLTRQLEALGADVLAVEPLPAMRAELAAAVPGVRCLAGSAEAIPLADGAVDAITVAQAFHWFDPRSALREMARVLIPGGGMALLWNWRDETVPWVAELARITKWHLRSPHDLGHDWAESLAPYGLFERLALATFRFAQPMTAELLVEQVRSRSYIAVMDAAARESIVDAVRALVHGWPEPFELPYVTDVWTARRDG